MRRRPVDLDQGGFAILAADDVLEDFGLTPIMDAAEREAEDMGAAFAPMYVDVRPSHWPNVSLVVFRVWRERAA